MILLIVLEIDVNLGGFFASAGTSNPEKKVGENLGKIPSLIPLILGELAKPIATVSIAVEKRAS